MKNWILFDIDGTIADCSHRIQYAQAKLWDEFHERAKDDEVIINVADMMRYLAKDFHIMLLTGRPDKYRHMTIEWLLNSGLHSSYDELVMRPDGNYVQDGFLKLALLEEFFGSQEDVLHNVWFAVDDRESVVEALRNYGLTVLQPAAGGY
jgi:hypothetical protein